MAFRYLDKDGALSFWTNIKNYIIAHIPTKTSELTNDSGFLTQHQSLANYVTTNTDQDIEGNKNFKGLLTTMPNGTIWPVTASTTDDITYLGANAIHVEQKGSGKLTDLSGGAWSVAELGVGCFFFRINNGADIRYKNFAQNTVNRIPVVSNANRFINDVTPNQDNTYDLGGTSNKWKSVYANSYYLGTTAFGDIVTHNASEFLTSHPSITLSSNTTSTASPAHGGTFTCIDSVTQDTNGHITKVNTKTITLPADSNTDTKVTQTVTTANSGYPVLLCATASATATETTTSRFSAGLTVNTRYSAIYMTNKYDTANTKGVRNTSSYSNGYIVFRCYDASEMGRIHCESSKNGYQQTYMQARSYIKNGAISPEGTATTCYITVRVRDNGSKTIYTDGSWENSLTPYANNTYSLGTSSLQWKNAYAVNIYENGTALSDKYLTVSAISGGASTSAGNITPVKGTIISGFADSSSVTYSTSFGAVLVTPTYLYYATGVFNSSNSTMEYFRGPSVGGTGTWKLMGGCVQNPGSNAKLLFGLWIKIV